SIVMAVGLIIFFYQFGYIARNHQFLLISFSFLTITAFLFSTLNGTDLNIKALYLLPQLGLFAVLVRGPNINLNYILIILYGWIIFVVYKILFQTTNPNELLGYASRNMVSWFALVLCIFYYIL